MVSRMKGLVASSATFNFETRNLDETLVICVGDKRFWKASVFDYQAALAFISTFLVHWRRE